MYKNDLSVFLIFLSSLFLFLLNSTLLIIPLLSNFLMFDNLCSLLFVYLTLWLCAYYFYPLANRIYSFLDYKPFIHDILIIFKAQISFAFLLHNLQETITFSFSLLLTLSISIIHMPLISFFIFLIMKFIYFHWILLYLLNLFLLFNIHLTNNYFLMI